MPMALASQVNCEGEREADTRREVAMEDLGENTTVLSMLRSLNSFISQRVEGGSGLDVPASAPGSLQMQYQQSLQLEERAEQIRAKSHLIQVEREKMQLELSHKRARVELEQAASTSARRYEYMPRGLLIDISNPTWPNLKHCPVGAPQNQVHIRALAPPVTAACDYQAPLGPCITLLLGKGGHGGTASRLLVGWGIQAQLSQALEELGGQKQRVDVIFLDIE
ncbi:Mitotic Spindle Assembly Checkpoint Protein Mad1 [Manis pentadactyla]|nr:Mitotic Spindle Assembly Checkpoint Protein Mad1 [Manis pentadactyla]